MTGAAYLTGVKSIDEEDVNEVIDQFVSQVLSTTNVMWAAANFHDVNMSEDIGIVANNLHYEALYLRRRLDRECDERMAQIYKDRPELREVCAGADDDAGGDVEEESDASLHAYDALTLKLENLKSITAMIYAIDKDDMNDKAFNGVGYALESMVEEIEGLASKLAKTANID